MGTPKPKDVLPLAQEITRLETQLAEAKRKWNALFGVTEPEKRSRALPADGPSSKALAFVDQHAGVIFTISMVAEGIGEPDELAVGRALYRLAAKNRIVSPSRGRYTSLASSPEELANPEELEVGSPD
jgi:hypothetical protein